VLGALVERVLMRVFGLASTALDSSRTADLAFESAVRATVASIAAHKPVMRLILTEAPNLPLVKPVVRGSYIAHWGLVTSYLCKLDPPVANPTTAAWVLLGTVLVHLNRWAVFEEIDDGQLVAELVAAAHLLQAAVR
jgi:hypothetical protein